MARAPNVLWLVSDHHALGNRGAIAQTFTLQTRLAAEGIRCTRAYTTLPICSPARASMLTGVYPHAHGVTENDGRFGGREGLSLDDWLVTDAFRANDYRCAWFGKWHVDNQRDASAYGLEGFSLPGYGYPYATNEYRAYLDRRDLPQPVVRVEMPGESGTPRGEQIALCDADNWFDFEAGVSALETPAQTHEAFFLADLAGLWLEEIGDEPFFLRVDTWGPHPPYILPTPFFGSLSREVPQSAGLLSDLRHRPPHHRAYRDYWQSTLNLDTDGWLQLSRYALEHVAVIETALAGLLDTLDRLGLAENTIVAFTADHGDATGSNGGVSNKGSLMVEETMRVPLLLRGPGIAAGEMNTSLTANFDLVPTLLRQCGIEVPEGLHADALFEQARSGLLTQHYGLHQPDFQRCWHEGPHKLVVQEDGFVELYDLQIDPWELDNLADKSPALRDKLWQNMIEAMVSVDDTDSRTRTIRQA